MAVGDVRETAMDRLSAAFPAWPRRNVGFTSEDVSTSQYTHAGLDSYGHARLTPCERNPMRRREAPESKFARA